MAVTPAGVPAGVSRPYQELAIMTQYTSPMVAGNVYSLHVGTRDDKCGAIASAMVAITANGAEVLCDSREALVE